MKVLGFDIETYRDHFVCVTQLWDTDTKQMIKEHRVTDDGKAIDRTRIAVIHQLFKDILTMMRLSEKFILMIFQKWR